MADGWDEGFRYGVETFDVGVSAMATYMAASAPPVFERRRLARSPPGWRGSRAT